MKKLKHSLVLLTHLHDILTSACEMLNLELVSKQADLIRRQKAVQRSMNQVQILQHWYSRDEHFQCVG